MNARRIALIGLGMAVGKSALAAALRAETAAMRGRALGLTADEASEVVRAWSEYHRCRPDPISWDEVERALVRRSIGQEWRPGER